MLPQLQDCMCLTSSRHLIQALQLFQQAFQEGLLPDKVTFLRILSTFSKHTPPIEAKWMHTYVIANDHDSNVMVRTALIHVYGKLSCVDPSRNLFDTMSSKNVVAWNAMITAFALNGEHEMVLLLSARMEIEGVSPSRVTYILIVNACTKMLDLAQGMRVHTCIIANNIASDVVLETALVTMYGKCGIRARAKKVFDGILEPNVVSWTAMLTAYCDSKEHQEAFHLFTQMQEQQVAPNDVTFLNLVSNCAERAFLPRGMSVHALIVVLGFDLVTAVNNALINMYRKCGFLEEAWNIFSRMPTKDVIAWNEAISMYAGSGQNESGINLFKQMCETGFLPTKVTFIGLLDACGNLSILSEAYKVHYCMVHTGMESIPKLVNSVINAYGLCHSLADAEMMFDMCGRHDTVSWNSLLGAYVQHGKGDAALTLFRQMTLEGVMANNVTLLGLFSACACINRLVSEGSHLHACFLMGTKHLSEVVVHNALLSMYCKCNDVLGAYDAFINMPEHNVVSWNIMLSAYADCRLAEKVFPIFSGPLSEGILPDEASFIAVLSACPGQGTVAEIKQLHVRILACRDYPQIASVWNALVDAYGKCNSLDNARKIFDELPEPGLVAWNAMIGVFAESSLAIELFGCMLQQGVIPDEFTFIGSLSACANLSILGIAEQMHARMSGIETITDSVVASSALVKVYGSCGKLENAWSAFDAALEKNLISWNAMLTMCAHAGQGVNALRLFDQMWHEGVAPDEITFVAILSACSHDALIHEADSLFLVIESKYGIQVIEDHYNCMIDALAKAGQLEMAECVAKSISTAALIPMITLLSACRTHLDFQRGCEIAKRVLEGNPCAAVAYEKLTHLFAPGCAQRIRFEG